MADITVTATQLKNILKTAIKQKHQILMAGDPGTGKTAIEGQATAELNHEGVEIDSIYHSFDDSPIDNIPEYASVADPTDYKGLPGMHDGGAHFFPIGIVRRLIEAKSFTVCFLDDLGQAPLSVQAALMQLIHGRKLNGYVIPDHIIFMGATNYKHNKAAVNGIIEPLKSRFHSIVNLVADPDSWCTWAFDNGIVPELPAFIRFRPNFLVQDKMTLSLENSSNPRTLEHVSDIQKAGYDPAVQYQMFCGAAGQAMATEYQAFLSICRSLPSIDGILLDPTAADVPTDPATLYATCSALARKSNLNTIDRLCTYSNRLPPEFSVLLIKDSINIDKSIVNSPAFIKWSAKNSDILI